MRTWLTALTVLVLSALASPVSAERNLMNYRKDDAGTLVISFSLHEGERGGGTLIERSDWTGSVQISSEPRAGQHDFTEVFDSQGFIRANGLAALDNPETQYYDKVEIIKLPPGKYHFWRPEKEQPDPIFGRLEPVHAEFDIQTGSMTYVGSFRYIGMYGKNRFGLRSMQYVAVQHVNLAERDLAIAKSVGINVDDPIIIGPDAPSPPR